METVVFVPTHGEPLFHTRTKAVPTGERTLLGARKTELQSEEVQYGESDSHIDGERLQTDLQAAVDDLNSRGFEVVAVTPVISGDYKSWPGPRDDTVGVGYSYTSGFIIVGRRD